MSYIDYTDIILNRSKNKHFFDLLDSDDFLNFLSFDLPISFGYWIKDKGLGQEIEECEEKLNIDHVFHFFID